MNRFGENPLFFFMDETQDMMTDEFDHVGKIIEISDVGCDAGTPRSSWQKIAENNLTKRESRGDSRLRNLERIGDYSRKDKSRTKDDIMRSERMCMDVNYEDFQIVSDTRIIETSKNTEVRSKESSIKLKAKSEAPHKKFESTNRESRLGLNDFKRNEISGSKENWMKNDTRVPINEEQSLNRQDARKMEKMQCDRFDEFVNAKKNSDLSLFYDTNLDKVTATCADSLSNLSKHSNASDVSVKSKVSSASRISKNSIISRNSTKFYDNYSKNYITHGTKDSAVSGESNLIRHVDFESKVDLKKCNSEISMEDIGNLTIEEIRARRTRTKDIVEPKCKYPRCDDWQSYSHEGKDQESIRENRLLVERGESPINLRIENSSIHLRTKGPTKISRGQSPIRFSDIRAASQNSNSAKKSFFLWGKCQDNRNSLSSRSINGKSVSALRKRVSEIPRPIKMKFFGSKRESDSNQTKISERTQPSQTRKVGREVSPKTANISQKVESSVGAKLKADKSQGDSLKKSLNMKSASLNFSTREVGASIGKIDWTKDKKMEFLSTRSNLSRERDGKRVPVKIRQERNLVPENTKKSKTPASLPRENTKVETSVENSAKLPEVVENVIKAKSTKTNIYNLDKTKNNEVDVVPIMERDTIESFSFTPKFKIPTDNTLHNVCQDDHETILNNQSKSKNQSNSTLWNPEYDAFSKSSAVGTRVIKMAKAARDERKRVYVNYGFDDYKKRPRDTSQEILDIGMTVIENVLQSPEEFLSSKISAETLEDYRIYDSATDWSPRDSNETFWFI